MIARTRIVLDTTNICFHVNVQNASLLICAPNFDLVCIAQIQNIVSTYVPPFEHNTTLEEDCAAI